MSEIQITHAGTERIDDLEPLYRALHLHHAELAPRLAGMDARAVEESWARRRSRYQAWLREPGAFVLLAARGPTPLGFALVTITEPFDSWHSTSPIGEVRDLAVLPAERGAGLGTLLLERVAAELKAADIAHYKLTVLAPNEDAIRFYERAGLTTVTRQMLGPT